MEEPIKKRGRPVSEKPRQKVTLSLDAQLVMEAKIFAIKNSMTLSDVVDAALIQYINADIEKAED